MGIDLLAPCLAIPHGRDPGWEAAARWIAELHPEIIIGAGELFPIEAWLEEHGTSDGGDARTPGHAIVVGARESLTRSASLIRGAIEDPAESQLLEIRLPDHDALAACALDASVDDFDLTLCFTEFGESGVARAAGFEHWTPFAEVPIDERTAGSWLSAEELRAPSSPLDPILAIKPEPALLGPESMAWVAVSDPDWAGGQRYIECHDLPDDLDEDLEIIWGHFEDDYARMVVPERIGSVDLLLVADCDLRGECAMDAIEALGTECVLDAVGAFDWKGRHSRAPRAGAEPA